MSGPRRGGPARPAPAPDDPPRRPTAPGPDGRRPSAGRTPAGRSWRARRLRCRARRRRPASRIRGPPRRRDAARRCAGPARQRQPRRRRTGRRSVPVTVGDATAIAAEVPVGCGSRPHGTRTGRNAREVHETVTWARVAGVYGPLRPPGVAAGEARPCHVRTVAAARPAGTRASEGELVAASSEGRSWYGGRSARTQVRDHDRCDGRARAGGDGVRRDLDRQLRRPRPSTSPSAAAPASASTAAKFLACEVTDTGGINDRSFNASAYQGLKVAAKADPGPDLHLPAVELHQRLHAEHQHADQPALRDHRHGRLRHGQRDQGGGQGQPDRRSSRSSTSTTSRRRRTSRASPTRPTRTRFLGGYLAAAMSKSGKVGTFGGQDIPPVTIYMDGFVAGVRYYDKINNAHVVGARLDPEGRPVQEQPRRQRPVHQRLHQPGARQDRRADPDVAGRGRHLPGRRLGGPRCGRGGQAGRWQQLHGVGRHRRLRRPRRSTARCSSPASPRASPPR